MHLTSTSPSAAKRVTVCMMQRFAYDAMEHAWCFCSWLNPENAFDFHEPIPGRTSNGLHDATVCIWCNGACMMLLFLACMFWTAQLIPSQTWRQNSTARLKHELLHFVMNRLARSPDPVQRMTISQTIRGHRTEQLRKQNIDFAFQTCITDKKETLILQNQTELKAERQPLRVSL